VRLRRFAVQSAQMVIPGDDLESAHGDDFVITDGLAEIVDDIAAQLTHIVR
jgi:hypothetical protein